MKDTDWIRLHQIIGQAVKDESFLDANQVSVVKLRDVYESICTNYGKIIKDIREDLGA